MAFSRALYFAAIVPPPAVREEVLDLKLEIKEKFETSQALRLPAHITLVPPVWLENELEQSFINTLKIVAEETAAFPVGLKNFGHFGQRVIFFNVVNHKAINELHQKLVYSLTEFLPDRDGKLHPHVTLASRDLSRENFSKAWKEFKDKSYSAEFKARSLTLFRHNGKTWDILKEFSFSEKNHR